MLNPEPTARMLGFSLIELMITIVIFSIAMAYGIPGYRTWTQNTQIRNAAESIQNGMMRARAEAVKRNTSVAFEIKGADSSWIVRVASAPTQACNVTGLDRLPTTLDVRCANEGSRNVGSTVTPGGATVVTFNNFGLVVDTVDTITQIELKSTALDTTARTLLITVNKPSGSIRICDPKLAAGNPQAC